jgi:hypothetical protein
MNLTVRSLSTSSSMAWCFSSLKWCSHYFTGLDPGLIHKEYSASTLGMSSCQRVSTRICTSPRGGSRRACFPLWERLAPMCIIHQSAHLGSKGSSFASFINLKVVPTIFALGICLSTARDISNSSWLTAVPSARSKHSTSYSYACYIVVSTVIVPAGPSILSFR